MKVTRVAFAIVMMAVSAVEPQFTRFPELPSPPRVIFGGFRPMFRPRSPRRQRFRPPPLFRSSRRPSFFQQQNQFNRIPSAQPLQLRPPPPPPPQTFQSTRPAQAVRPTASIRITPPASTMLPPPPPSPRIPQQPTRGSLVIRLPEQPPSPPRVTISSSTPHRTPQRDARGFGSPKPNSIVSNFRPSSSDPPNDGKQLISGASFVVSTEQSKSPQSGFPRPLPRQNDNNIIGMFPPPPPPVTTTLAPLVVAQTTPTLPPTSLTSASPNISPALTTISNISPALTLSNIPPLISLTSSNSLINELPLLNAGVLPLAGEDENEHMLFPPFSHLGVSSDLLSEQELFPPFPPNQDLFPPFDST